jgi:3-hydroxyisobutyrate dehydrogenase-like beta-hydroxyacid dehydrogenase
VIVSVCPPGEALRVADGIANAGFAGIYVDANAIAPATARKIAARFDRFVDGGIIGPPVRDPAATRLYLSGAEAARVAELWTDTPLTTRVIAGGAGQASALKLCYAAWTKQTSALLLAIRALARAEGVEASLLDEWATSLPELAARSESAAASNTPKAWRFVGEMQQIGDAFGAQDLPDGFSRAAAEIFDRLSAVADPSTANLDVAIDALLRTANE